MHAFWRTCHFIVYRMSHVHPLKGRSGQTDCEKRHMNVRYGAVEPCAWPAGPGHVRSKPL